MKETYIAPSVETVDFCSQEPIAKTSLNFSDFFTKSIDDELALKENNNNT